MLLFVLYNLVFSLIVTSLGVAWQPATDRGFNQGKSLIQLTKICCTLKQSHSAGMTTLILSNMEDEDCNGFVKGQLLYPLQSPPLRPHQYTLPNPPDW